MLNDETLLGWFNEGMAGAVGGAVASPVTVAADRAMDRQMIRDNRAGRTALVLDRMVEMADATELANTDPQKFGELLEAQGLGDQPLLIPAQDMQEYFQQTGLDEDVTLEAWNIDRGDYNAALARNGDVTMSMATYATNIRGSDHIDWVRENATRNEGEMSLSEQKAFREQGFRRLMADAADQARQQEAGTAQRSQGEQALYDRVYDDLLQAGRADDQARNEAAVTTAMRTSLMSAFGEEQWQAGNYDQLFNFRVRSVADVANVAGAVELQQTDTRPTTIDELPPGWQDAEIEVELEDGEVALANAGEVIESQNQRIKDIMAVLRCVNG